MRHLRFIVFVGYLLAITGFAVLHLRKTDREIELAIERKTYQIRKGVAQTSTAIGKPPPSVRQKDDTVLPPVGKAQLRVYRTRPDLTRLLFDQAARAAQVVRILRERPRTDNHLASEVRRHTEEVRRKVLLLQQQMQESSKDVSRAAREAEPAFERMLTTLVSVLGPDHPEVASGSQNLATLYYLQERYEEAEPLYKRALDIWERTPEPDQGGVADALKGYAMLLRKMARSEEADRMEMRSLSIRQLQPALENPGSSELRLPGMPKSRKPA